MKTSTMRTAFVGQKEVNPATEYHDSDFSWEEHAEVAGPLLERKLPKEDAGGGDDGDVDERQGTREETSPRPSAPAPPADYLSAWEAFHGRDNSSSRFYKERRYLPLAFPRLRDEVWTRHVLEVGCGCGSALVPVLRSNGSCVVTGTDVSPRAVSAFLEAAASSGLAERNGNSRIAGAFPLDATAADACDVLTQRLVNSPPVDAVLLVFTLGALEREDQVSALQVAAAALRAGRGGEKSSSSSSSSSRPSSSSPPTSPPPSSPRVFIRDHGLFDVTHMRAPRRVRGNLHSRSDGTLCYFFSPEDLEATAREAGLRAVCCKWATVERANKKTGQVLRRVFVHGEFELVE